MEAEEGDGAGVVDDLAMAAMAAGISIPGVGEESGDDDGGSSEGREHMMATGQKTSNGQEAPAARTDLLAIANEIDQVSWPSPQIVLCINTY